jgi:hypothetical protein
MKLFSKSVLGLCVVSLGAVASLPAQAIPQSYTNGSATIVLMNGASQSTGGEIALPGNGAYYGDGTAGSADATLSVNFLDGAGSLGPDLANNETTIQNILLDPGTTITQPTATGTFTAAASAALLEATNTLADEVSIIRAGAGVDGLE